MNELLLVNKFPAQLHASLLAYIYVTWNGVYLLVHFAKPRNKSRNLWKDLSLVELTVKVEKVTQIVGTIRTAEKV